MRLVFMGTPAFVVPVLEALLAESEVQVVGIYTQPDRPRGRGRTVELTPVKSAGVNLGLPVFQPASLRSARAQQELADLRPDVILVAAYGRFLPPEVLDLPPHCCLNLHPSLLPKYRGPAPVVTTILDGEAVTGVTLMQLDEGMDTGPILAQQEYPLNGDETAADLTEALFRTGAQLLLDNLEALAAGKLPAQPQDDSRATVTRKLERADGLADWTRSAVTLERQQRAFTPWPGLTAYWQDKSLRLLDVAPLNRPDLAGADPGLVVSLPSEETPAGIITADGILGLKSVQLEGRRATSIAEFLRGYPAFISSRL